MKTKTAIDYFGNQAALAKALNITTSAITQWGEEVPARRALELEKLTAGALGAENGYPKTRPGMQVTTAA